jgi:hypothetical protein
MPVLLTSDGAPDTLKRKRESFGCPRLSLLRFRPFEAMNYDRPIER